jgi:hypothetical protein
MRFYWSLKMTPLRKLLGIRLALPPRPLRLAEPLEAPADPNETDEERQEREERERKEKDKKKDPPKDDDPSQGSDPDDDDKSARTVAMAQAIVNAGRRRGGEAPITLDAPSPKDSSAFREPFRGTAEQRAAALRIVNAGRRSRGEAPLKSLDDDGS